MYRDAYRIGHERSCQRYKKRVLSLLLTGAVLVGMLSGCGTVKEKEENSGASHSARQQDKEKRRSGGAALQTAPRNRRSGQPVTMQEQEVQSDGQA